MVPNSMTQKVLECSGRFDGSQLRKASCGPVVLFGWCITMYAPFSVLNHDVFVSWL